MSTNSSVRPFVLESSWHSILEEELALPYMSELASFVENEYAYASSPVYPPRDLIFNAFNKTPFDQVKVVLIGQDPYHGPDQADGLSFSVPIGIKPPPSLQNIFKELQSDLQLPPFSHGCLISWAKQGVMLLNATLTVSQGAPLSHHNKGWERFTDAVVHCLTEREDPVIFVLWGRSAQEKCRFIQESAHARHYILTAPHPSPFSARTGFFGCRHFSKINEALIQQGKRPIEWHF